MLNRQSNDDVPRKLTPTLPSSCELCDLRMHTLPSSSNITIYIPSRSTTIVINMSRHDARVRNCIGYHALRQHLTQPDLNARARAIEQTRNLLLNPSMFRI